MKMMKTSDDLQYTNDPIEYTDPDIPIYELQEYIDNMDTNKPKKPSKYFNKKWKYYVEQLKQFKL